MSNTPTPIAHFSDGTPVPFDGRFHVDPLNSLISVRCREPWAPPGVLKVVAGGNTASLGLLSDNSLLKFPADRHDRFAEKALSIEHCILSRLGDHDRIVKYLGRGDHGLVFQRAAKGDVRHYMSAVEPCSIPLHLRIQWSIQAAEGLAFVHSCGIVHCDIHPNNFLLDDTLNLRLCDFSGSLFGDLDGAAMESTRFFLPRDPRATPNVKSDLFALGSAIYYIMSGREPYDNLSDDEVEARYSRGDFPGVDSISCGQIIKSCWDGGFDCADEVFQALLGEREALILS
ncbi:kinase-like protein [Corynespora cassiicola Philippines]|uniref:Kinase-like protein n=1 Tax=Corynespora cassiicola Philippines TaxID=1448308 RepID=A0A2T2P803_CORCC|nr:kinase-like protein [Corynespora cassiicola Philippines]